MEIILSFSLLPCVLLLFNRTIRDAPAIQFLLLTSLAHFAGYSILHVPPYYWYYIPEITAVVLIGSFGLGILFQNGNAKTPKINKVPVMAATLLVLQALGMLFILVRNGIPVDEMPIHTNWATHEQYVDIGQWLKEHTDGDTILVDGEVGTLGYYCDCHVSSFFSDRSWLIEYVDQQIISGGIKSVLYKVNFLFLDPKTKLPQPIYLLTETPLGSINNTPGLMEWRTSTKWVPDSLIQLSDYSD